MDNQALVSILNHQTSNDSHIIVLVQDIVLQALTFNVVF